MFRTIESTLKTFLIIALCAATSGVISGTVVNAATVGATSEASSPYGGQETRGIKALSQQQIEDYLSGRGLGYAKTAELNHYPGPRHVLDLARELALTRQQTGDSQLIYDAMKAQAVALGRQLVEQEKKLDQQFADESVDEQSLRTMLSKLGELEAELRYVHLSAHFKQKALLTKHQVRLYDQLRGYGDGGEQNHSHTH